MSWVTTRLYGHSPTEALRIRTRLDIMKLFYTDHFELPLPDKHRFPMAKYRLLRERLAASESSDRFEFLVPVGATRDQLCLAHQPDYVDRVWQGTLDNREIRRIGFPWSAGLLERSRRSVGATLAAARAALDDGRAANLAGGTHHAYAQYGEGFCVFNDVAVTIRSLQAEGAIQRAVVIDADVHQGNGTAAIFDGDESVFTFSIHGAKNFPLRKHPSDLDIALADGVADDEYLQRLAAGLDETFRHCTPQLAFYLAGADPYEGDRLGKLKLTKSGLAARDQMVLDACVQRGLPLAIAMAGGYARDVNDIVDIHARTIQIAVAASHTS